MPRSNPQRQSRQQVSNISVDLDTTSSGSASRRFSREIFMVVAISSGVFCFLWLVLFDLEIPLGEPGALVYRWTAAGQDRILRSLVLLVLFGGFAAAVFQAVVKNRHCLACAFVLLFAITSAAWIWWLPPNPMAQHVMNFTSPSQDGAFLREAWTHSNAIAYLRNFDDRLGTSIDEMRGTRVLSNPPGMTLLSMSVRRIFPPRISPAGWLERYLVQSKNVPESDVGNTADSLRLSVVLCVMWLVSAITAYGLGTVFLSTAGAVLFAILVMFSASVINFTPGKDTAQLLTINAMLWAWFGGRKHNCPISAAVAGAIMVIGATFGLIHIWVGAAACSASVWNEWPRWRGFMIRAFFPAVSGAAAVIAIVYFSVGWNIPLTLMHVAVRFGQVQTTIGYNRTLWVIIGLPLFLLFLGPGVWVFAWLAYHRPRPCPLGRRLLLCTISVMLVTYLMGVTYELPRLWVAFIPCLTLALMMHRPFVRCRDNRRVYWAIVLIAGAQILATASSTAFLDARESEFRIATHRYFSMVDRELVVFGW